LAKEKGTIDSRGGGESKPLWGRMGVPGRRLVTIQGGPGDAHGTEVKEETWVLWQANWEGQTRKWVGGWVTPKTVKVRVDAGQRSGLREKEMKKGKVLGLQGGRTEKTGQTPAYRQETIKVKKGAKAKTRRHQLGGSQQDNRVVKEQHLGKGREANEIPTNAGGDKLCRGEGDGGSKATWGKQKKGDTVAG